jgi:hypothetical protein
MGGDAAYDAAPYFTRLRARLTSSSTRISAHSQHYLGPWLCIALGTLLRLVWPLDFEWKADEKWMFEKALRIAQGADPWPWIGMPSGVGMQNPGASIWPFALLAHVAPDPPRMNFAVSILNVLALWGFALWVLRTWSERDRTVGMWGVGLFAVSPLPVLFARKIWAQDVLPALLVPCLWAHSRRNHVLAAFAWGALGATLGQVHMSGFFAAAGLTLATLITDRKRTRWAAWFAGSATGALPLLPWFAFVLSPEGKSTGGYTVSLRFFLDAFLSAWGLHLRYSLRKNFGQFLRWPEVFGHDSWIVALAHAALLGIAVLCAIVLFRKRRSIVVPPEVRIHAIAIGLSGLLLHLAGVLIYPHYLIVFSPMLHVLAAFVLSQQLVLLWSAGGLQLCLTASFLTFIHQHGGAPRGDYGVTYRAQSPDQRAVGTK